MRPSKQPFHIAHSQVPSFPSRRFVPSPTRLHCTGTQSLIYLMLTHEPSASFGKHTVSTWLLTDFQTLRVGWQDLTPLRLRVHARKWLSSRAQLQHRLVSSTRNQIQVFLCIFFFIPLKYWGKFSIQAQWLDNVTCEKPYSSSSATTSTISSKQLGNRLHELTEKDILGLSSSCGNYESVRKGNILQILSVPPLPGQNETTKNTTDFGQTRRISFLSKTSLTLVVSYVLEFVLYIDTLQIQAEWKQNHNLGLEVKVDLPLHIGSYSVFSFSFFHLFFTVKIFLFLPMYILFDKK